jgi:hypothetical protein
MKSPNIPLEQSVLLPGIGAEHTDGTEYPKGDAIADMMIWVTDRDIACATPRDHCTCAVAQAISRTVGHPSARAVIYPTSAWVLVPVDAATARHEYNRGRALVVGELAWLHFLIDRELSQQIQEFDRTGIALPSGYRLRRPRPSQTLNQRKIRNGEHVRHPTTVPVAHMRDRQPWLRGVERRVSNALPIEPAE